jgi:hypothetical protein
VASNHEWFDLSTGELIARLEQRGVGAEEARILAAYREFEVEQISRILG